MVGAWRVLAGVLYAVRITIVGEDKKRFLGVGINSVGVVFENRPRSPRRPSSEPSGLPEMILHPYDCGQGSRTQDRSKSWSWQVLSLSMSASSPQSKSKCGERGWALSWTGPLTWTARSKTGHGPDEGPGLSPMDYLR